MAQSGQWSRVVFIALLLRSLTRSEDMKMSTAGVLTFLLLSGGCCFSCYATGVAAAAVPVARLAALLVCAAGVLVLLVQLARFCHQQLRMYWITRSIPGPSPTLPLLGNLFQLAALPQEDVMGCLMDLRERLGPTFRVWFGPYLGICCCEPEDLKVVFSHEHLQYKASVYYAANLIIGDGLVTLQSSHQRHRKALAPGFQLNVIKSFIPAFASEGRTLMKALETLSCSGETFDASAMTDSAVSRVACKTLMSNKDLLPSEEIDSFGAHLHEGANFIMYLVMRPWLWKSDLCFRLLAPGVFKEKERMFKMLDDGVRCALEFHERRMLDKKEERAAESGDPREALDHILKSTEVALIDREELVGDIRHIIGGGIGTTGDLLSLLMISLALTPEVQEKVHQELDEVFADDPSRMVTADDLPKLRYLEMTLKEVMRYFPLVPIIARNAAEDVTLPSGAVVPRDSMVVILPKTVHWDPRWYPDPSAFNPDRHDPEVADTRPTCSFIPFAAGSRGCIGPRYAMILGKTIAATFLREYRFLPAPGGVKRLCDLKVVIGIFMQVQGGVRVRVERRQRLS